MPTNLPAWLTLLSVPGLGPAAYGALISRFGCPERALSTPLSALRLLPGLRSDVARLILEARDGEWVQGQISRAADAGITILTLEDEDYPPLLRQIYAPPPVLFAKGSQRALQMPGVAIVGSRAFTSYGRSTANRLAGALAARGLAVVSGLAMGIDTHAHTGALSHDGVTTAVLGSGLDVIYPRQNAGLFKQITDAGVVLSEFPMGTSPEAHNFPRRNRVISGLSLGVVVVEAGARSGALITARHALEQNRDVFAVPGPIHSGRSTGTHALLKDGAILVQSVEDILEELPATATPPVSPGLNSRTDLDAQPELEPQHRGVFKYLTFDDAVHVDDIASGTSLSVPETLSILLDLELRGLADQRPGKRFVRRVR